jgi:hypothetical protein
MQPIDKKHKKIGMIVGVTLNALIIIAAFQSCDKLNPPIEEPDPPLETVAVMDFSGGGASGGSETTKDKPEQDAAPTTDTKPVTEPEPETQTQVEPSPVISKPATSATSESDGEGTSQTPAFDPGSLFGGSNGGNEGGNGAGTGTGIGPGTGPTTTGTGDGVGPGSHRIAVKKPSFKNPVDQVGNILVKLIIYRNGKVKSATVQRNNENTTAGMSEKQFKVAQEESMKYVFNEVGSDEPALQGLYITVKFKLD